MEVFKSAVSESDNCLLNSVSKIPFLGGEVGRETSKCFVLNETWYMYVFKDADSEFENCFFNFHPLNISS